jgi:hypothetical protein
VKKIQNGDRKLYDGRVTIITSIGFGRSIRGFGFVETIFMELIMSLAQAIRICQSRLLSLVIREHLKLA